MRIHNFIAVVLLAGPATADAQALDFLYEDVLIALTHQCSQSFPDLKDSIDRSIDGYVNANAEMLSADYVERLRHATPDDQPYTREQCVGMAKLPQEPMKDLMIQYANELKESEEVRAKYERSQE